MIVTASVGGPRVPSAPTDLRFTPDGDRLVLEWEPPVSSGTAPIEQYRLQVHDRFIVTASTDPRVEVEGLPTETTIDILLLAESAVGRGEQLLTTTRLPSDPGYWLAERAGTLHEFGAAQASESVSAEIVSIATTPDGEGLWVLDAAGVVHVRGEAPTTATSTSLAWPPVNR